LFEYGRFDAFQISLSVEFSSHGIVITNSYSRSSFM